jgi:hypothetical protein
MSRKFINMDADESVFFSRQLEHVKAATYDVQYPELKARQFIPVSSEAGPGADTITYRQYDMLGFAKIISNYALDLPRVDLKGKEFTAKIRSIGAGYGYSMQDIRRAKITGMPLEQRKATAAKKAIEQLVDELACNGDADHGLVGLFGHPNIPDVAIPADGTGASALWSAKTADQILRDMNLLVTEIVVNTHEVEAPTTMLVPLFHFNLISTLRVGDTGLTVKELFLKNSPYIKEILPWNKLKGAGAGGTDLFMAYNKSPDKLTLEIPQDFEQFPVQEKGLEYEVNCHARIGGVLVYYPLSLAKGDGI